MSGLEVTPALIGQAQLDGPCVVGRHTQPIAPALAGATEQQAINSIREAALFQAPHLAIMTIGSVRTINQNPAIAIYKTEMMEYLRGKA